MQDVALVVEDDKSLMLLYDQILRKLGFTVVAASDGTEALERLQNHTPVVIFLDLLLPRVNGKAVLDYILNAPHLSKTLVAIISSNQQVVEVQNLPTDVEFYQKPILPKQIREIAQRARAIAT